MVKVNGSEVQGAVGWYLQAENPDLMALPKYPMLFRYRQLRTKLETSGPPKVTSLSVSNNVALSICRHQHQACLSECTTC